MTDANLGSFVWYDLMADKADAAIAFYTHVVGWKAEPWENGYTMFVGSQGPVGGTTALPEDARKMGVPPHWLAHVSVADIEATVAKAKKLGGTIRLEPTDIPKVGRFAILVDPQGAQISAVQLIEGMPRHDLTKVGEMTWNELVTSDREAALRFYGELFGWKVQTEHDMGPMGKYSIYGLDTRELGGIFALPKGQPGPPPSFLYYVHVEDLDAALARAKSKGAKVLNGPMPVPGGARIVQLTDPEGAAFALHEAAKA